MAENDPEKHGPQDDSVGKLLDLVRDSKLTSDSTEGVEETEEES
jgi:hypothetical protein